MTTMDDEELDKLARDIALRNVLVKPYKLNVERLAKALKEAITAYDGEDRMWQRRKRGSRIISQLDKATSSLKRAKKQWDGLTAADKALVSEFVSDAFKVSEIDDRLTFLVDLFEEFAVHHKNERGNPGYARLGDGKDLKPLRDFVRILMVFWIEETNTSFGHQLIDADDVEEGIRLPHSPAMDFLDHACGALGGFHVGSLETVVRSIKAEGIWD